MGNVVHSTYTTGTGALPVIYAQAQGPQARGLVRTYQSACGISVTYFKICVQIMAAIKVKF